MTRLPSLLLAGALLCAVPLAAQTAQPWETGTYLYDGAGNIKSIGADQFRYDAIGRLRSGMAGPGRTQSVTYDAYGNIRTMTTDGTTLTFGVNSSTNRMSETGYNAFGSYDNAGRLLSTSGGNSFVYDGNDTVTRSTVDGTTRVHLYSINDERIASITVDASGNEVRSDWTLRDHLHRVVRRMEKNGAAWVWKEDYIYRGGPLLAAEENGQTLHFYLDHLGTVRLITGNGGMKIAQHTYFPFGIEATAANQDNEKLKFTGHERDAASLDYMHARYYNPHWGRFQSADPGKDWDVTKSQSWNLYTYVRNSPINLFDPTGRAVFANAQQLSKAGEEVISRDNLKPVELANGKLQTYCNFGVREILQEGGDHTLDGKTAAQMTEFLSDPANATKLTYEEAVEYAKQGATVIMAEPGHVAVVAPKDMKAAGEKWDKKEVPFVFNVGKKNEVLQLNKAFNAKNKPEAYILNKDKKEVDERNKPRHFDKKK